MILMTKCNKCSISLIY